MKVFYLSLLFLLISLIACTPSENNEEPEPVVPSGILVKSPDGESLAVIYKDSLYSNWGSAGLNGIEVQTGFITEDYSFELIDSKRQYLDKSNYRFEVSLLRPSFGKVKYKSGNYGIAFMTAADGTDSLIITLKQRDRQDKNFMIPVKSESAFFSVNDGKGFRIVNAARDSIISEADETKSKGKILLANNSVSSGFRLEVYNSEGILFKPEENVLSWEYTFDYPQYFVVSKTDDWNFRIRTLYPGNYKIKLRFYNAAYKVFETTEIPLEVK